MPLLPILILGFLIQLFPYVRRFLPQRDEDWLFEITKKHQNLFLLSQSVLEEHNPYYRQLSAAGKRRFIKRLMYLILNKTLLGYHDMKLNVSQAILILSAQVQLTFGMKKFSLPHFKKILVYPDIFYSNYLKADVKGLTSGLGYVNLSWKHSLKGYEDYRDNRNLLLHEFAHALIIQLAKQKDNDYSIERSFAKYGDKAVAIFERLKNVEGGHPYLRDYGMQNKHEFFAVCVEHFFESPLQFQHELPQLYALYCKLLGQDPANLSNDYKYS